MIGRLHPLLADVLRVRSGRDILRKPAEAGARSRGPAGQARFPGKPCEMDFCAAMASACWRAALARASSHFRGGRPFAARSRLMAWKSCCPAGSALGWAIADTA